MESIAWYNKSWGNLQVRKFQVHTFNAENNLSYILKNDKKMFISKSNPEFSVSLRSSS